MTRYRPVPYAITSGDEMRKWRRDNGLSRRKMAAIFNVAYNTYTSWEDGTHAADRSKPSTFIIIAQLAFLALEFGLNADLYIEFLHRAARHEENPEDRKTMRDCIAAIEALSRGVSRHFKEVLGSWESKHTR